MFHYSIYGQEENTVLMHREKFTQDEFERMCREAPLFEYGDIKAFYLDNIVEYLVDKYDFRLTYYTAKFCVDADIE